MNMKSVYLKIVGRVQGVYFRQSTREKAKELGIAGTVRNMEDGSVEVYAEGEAEQMRLFITWCNVGPLAAAVTKVEIHDSPLKNFDGFKIIH